MEIKFIELKQKHIEAFANEIPAAKDTKQVIYNGALLRAAIKAGWFIEPKIENVDEMNPSEVRKLAEAIIKEYARVMEISPS